MNILAISDLHGNADRIETIAHQLSAADIVLLVGDITHFGGRVEAHKIVQRIQEYAEDLLAVPGNCDLPEVDLYLTEIGINLHGRNRLLDDVLFIGVGGSLPCPRPTSFEFSEEEIGSLLATASDPQVIGHPVVLVSHQPPHGSVADLAYNGKHVGSKAIRTFIEESRPLVCFTGHIHEGVGIGTIEATEVVNPGPFARGGFAFGTIAQKVELLEIRTVE